MPAPAKAAEYFIQQEDTTEIIKLLAFSNKEDEIGKKWEEFLKERTRRFNHNDYQMAIYKLKSEYDKSYAMLDICIKNTDKKVNQHSSSWAKDFQQQFGKEYIRKNFDSIRFVVIALSMKETFASCEEQAKEAIYREYRYLDSAKNYVKYFIEFYETLNKEEKKKLNIRITATESYLKDFEYPLQSTLSNEGLKDALFSIALTQKDIDPQMIYFFVHHPFFMKPFDLVKVLDDLKTLQ